MRVLASVVILTACLSVSAAELGGVSMPDEITVDGVTLWLNGLGIREATMLKIDVYVAGLYVETRSSDARALIESDETKRLAMEFVRSVKKSKMVDAWEEGFEKNAGDESGALKDRIATFVSWVDAVEEGDKIVYTYVPGRGVEVEVNGSSKGVIEGADFARVLWSVWLGPEPPNAGLKDGLLGR